MIGNEAFNRVSGFLAFEINVIEFSESDVFGICKTRFTGSVETIDMSFSGLWIRV
uniref:Uncharacterized protein n=1 Tax=uncultured marine virus TaxID=186617 RepID=A0A0F7L8W8_9VIRU|nr:hypothetical protein [uncultured marine virus]